MQTSRIMYLPHPEWCISYSQWNYMTRHITQGSRLPVGPLLLLCFLWVCTRVMTCIHHYNVTRSYFHCPPKPLCSTGSSPLPPPTLAATDLFTVYRVLRFPECPIFGVTQYVAFSHWLLSLRNKCIFEEHFDHIIHSPPCPVCTPRRQCFRWRQLCRTGITSLN